MIGRYSWYHPLQLPLQAYGCYVYRFQPAPRRCSLFLKFSIGKVYSINMQVNIETVYLYRMGWFVTTNHILILMHKKLKCLN